MSHPLVKICGTTNLTDAWLAQRSGADYVGFVMNHPPSPRHISIDTAAEIMAAVTIPKVAVTVNLNLKALLALMQQTGASVLQLHGDEPALLVQQLSEQGLTVWKALSGDAREVRRLAEVYRDAGAGALLIDARESNSEGVVYGGTGQLSDWNLARDLVMDGHRIVLAGGLSAANVVRAIEAVQPWMVDAVSGVESSKGIKSAEEVKNFIRAVHTV